MGDAHSDVEEEEEESIMKEERTGERQRKEGRKFSSAPSLRPSSVRATRRRSRHRPPLPQEKDIVKHFSQSTQAEIGIEITV